MAFDTQYPFTLLSTDGDKHGVVHIGATTSTISADHRISLGVLLFYSPGQLPHLFLTKVTPSICQVLYYLYSIPYLHASFKGSET